VGFFTVMQLKKVVLAGCALAFANLAAAQGTQQNFAPERIKQGSATYARHCAACHGPRMKDPEGSFDLRKFPLDQRERFVTSVTKGKKAMPPWGDLLSTDDIDALWAYLVAGERN
jgi:mono/diheme cytochrome c family protein